MMKDITTRVVLPNGLTVLLQENHNAPVVSMNLWVKTGSTAEKKHEAGISHLIEHMLFKGTKRRGVGVIASEVEAAGGEINAYTSFDETVFYINMAREYADTGLDILADVAINSRFDRKELAREKEVIIEEISKYEDSPAHLVSDQLFSSAYIRHPYKNQIAGKRETVRKMSRNDILNFVRRWYVAPNMLLVVVGDFDKAKFLGKIKRSFEKLSPARPPSSSRPLEPLQKRPRIKLIPMPIEGCYLNMAFHIPEVTHKDAAVLDVAGHILGGSANSRLVQEIREKRHLVNSIGASPYTPKDPGLFVISATLEHGKLKPAIKAIFSEIERMAREGITEPELAKAKLNIVSDATYERETVEGISSKLGFFEVGFGDYRYEEKYYQRINTISTSEVGEVVKKYLRPSQGTLVICHPKEMRVNAEGFKKWSQAPFFKKSEKNGARHHFFAMHRFFTLSNGIRLIVKENHSTQLVSVRSASMGGVRLEPKTQCGVSNLAASLITKGTPHRTAKEIAYEAETIAGSIGGYSGRNTLGLKSTFLSSKLREGLGLFSDLLLNPSFPKKEFIKERRNTYQEIRQQEDSLSSVAYKNFLAALYPNHPYGRPTLGTKETLKKLHPKKLSSFYKRLITPANTVVSVVGDINPAEVRDILEEKLSNLKRAKLRNYRFTILKTPHGIITKKVRKKRFQGHIVIGFLGCSLNHKDRIVLAVLNQILSGQGGRLFLELRDKQSLAYSVSAKHEEGIEPGYFSVYIGTDGSKISTATSGILSELNKIRTEFVSASELARAKRHIIGTYALDQQDNSNVAAGIASYEIVGMGYREHFIFPEKIKKVTRKDILRVAKKYLTLNSYVLSLVHP